MIQAAEQLGKQVGVSAACRALGVPRSSLYRARQPKPVAKPRLGKQHNIEPGPSGEEWIDELRKKLR